MNILERFNMEQINPIYISADPNKKKKNGDETA